jgi:hypothetical protein
MLELQATKGGRHMTAESTSNDKQITIEVPEHRVAEFYAFYGRFLAGSPGRRGRGRGCGHRRAPAGDSAASAIPGTQTA